MGQRVDLENHFEEMFAARRRTRKVVVVLAFIVTSVVIFLVAPGFIGVVPKIASFQEPKKGSKACAYVGCARSASGKADVTVENANADRLKYSYSLCSEHLEMAAARNWPVQNQSQQDYVVGLVGLALVALVGGTLVAGLAGFLIDVNPYTAAPPPGAFRP